MSAKLTLQRLSATPSSTLGLLSLGGKPLCFVLEDEARLIKLAGRTRIPAGEYSIRLRTWGEHHQRYLSRFSSFHKGMLWLRNVPSFQHILIHLGNSAADTSGCLLLGESASLSNGHFVLLQSQVAYRRVYPILAQEAEKGAFNISIKDER